MGNPNRRPAAASKFSKQVCLHRSGNWGGWTYNDLHIQQEYASWIQTPFKKSQAGNGGNIIFQQQMSKMDEHQDWADEVLTAAHSGWEQGWDGDSWGKKVEEKRGDNLGGGESPLPFPTQSTVTLSGSLKNEEAGTGERQGDGSELWVPISVGVDDSGLDLRQDGGSETDFSGGMENIPEKDVSRHTAASSLEGDVESSV